MKPRGYKGTTHIRDNSLDTVATISCREKQLNDETSDWRFYINCGICYFEVAFGPTSRSRLSPACARVGPGGAAPVQVLRFLTTTSMRKMRP